MDAVALLDRAKKPDSDWNPWATSSLSAAPNVLRQW